MKVFQLASSVALLLLGFTRFASGQVEQSWEITHNPGSTVTFLQSDDEDNVYEVEQGANSAVFNLFDPFGDLIKSRTIQSTVTNLKVDPFTGVAAVSTANTATLFYWDGESITDTLPASANILALGIDADGNGVVVYNLNSFTTIDVVSEFLPLRTTTLTFLGSSATVDIGGQANILGFTGNGLHGTSFLEVFSEFGNEAFERSYSISIDSGTRIVGFVESPSGDDYYLELYTFTHVPNTSSIYIVAIATSQPNDDAWQSGDLNTSSGPLFTDAAGNLYVGSSTEVFSIGTAPANKGSILWTANIPCNEITESSLGPVIESYNSAGATVNIENLSPANGSVLSTAPIPAPASSNVGSICVGAGDSVYYGGSTGGTSSESEIEAIAYGPALSSAACPATVVGGNVLLLTLKPDATSESGLSITLTSSDPEAVSSEQVSLSQNTTFAMDSAPVDVDTPVTITATMNSPAVLRTATTVVKTATIASLNLVKGSGTATGTVTLTGKAGPSGKTVALSSNSAAVTVPSSLAFASGAVSNTFTATLHAVSVSTTVTVTASLGSTSQFASIVISPAALSSLVAPSDIEGGETGSVTINLTGPAGPTGDSVTVTSNSTDLTVTSPVLVPAGKDTVTFSVTTKSVTSNANVTLTATFNGVSKTATTTVTATASAVSSISLNPTTIAGGNNVEALVVLNAIAPPAGTVVTLKSNSTAATVPASIAVPAGAKQIFFVVKTSKITKATTLTITAGFNSSSASATLTVNP